MVHKQSLNSNLQIRRLKTRPWKKAPVSEFAMATNTSVSTTSSRWRFLFRHNSLWTLKAFPKRKRSKRMGGVLRHPSLLAGSSPFPTASACYPSCGRGKKTSLSFFDTPTKPKAISLSAALYFKRLPTCLSSGRDLRLPHSRAKC